MKPKTTSSSMGTGANEDDDPMGRIPKAPPKQKEIQIKSG